MNPLVCFRKKERNFWAKKRDRQSAIENRQLGKDPSLCEASYLVQNLCMFLQLNHQQFDVYAVARTFVTDCYVLTKNFPPEERFSLAQQIRRAALSVHLNLAEGFSRKSEQERKRFFEISRGSLIEIDAALDVAADLGYCQKESLPLLGSNLTRCFSMLSKLISH